MATPYCLKNMARIIPHRVITRKGENEKKLFFLTERQKGQYGIIRTMSIMLLIIILVPCVLIACMVAFLPKDSAPRKLHGKTSSPQQKRTVKVYPKTPPDTTRQPSNDELALRQAVDAPLKITPLGGGRNEAVSEVQEPCSPRDFSHALQAQRAAERHAATTFVAIDFETANSRYYSACALGMVVFEDGEPKNRRLYMINPGCKFDEMNVSIHGITQAQVADAPKFDALWSELVPILRKFRVVAYSDFDAKVLRSLIRHYGLAVGESFTLNYLDACQYARDNILGLTNYKLPTVAKFLQIDGLKHHDAVSDAETCGRIYVRLCAEKGRKIRASMDIPATYAQQDYIRHLGGEVPPTLSKVDASKLITELIERQRREAEEAVAKRRRGKEEAELQFMAAAMRDPGYKLAKRGAKRTQDLREFQYLVNLVIADDIIEPQEMLEIKAWLEAHKVLDADFSQTLRLIADLLKREKSGQIGDNDMQELYTSLLDCLNELRRRPTV